LPLFTQRCGFSACTERASKRKEVPVEDGAGISESGKPVEQTEGVKVLTMDEGEVVQALGPGVTSSSVRGLGDTSFEGTRCSSCPRRPTRKMRFWKELQKGITPTRPRPSPRGVDVEVATLTLQRDTRPPTTLSSAQRSSTILRPSATAAGCLTASFRRFRDNTGVSQALRQPPLAHRIQR
jgi:hypothetical protein